MEIKITDARVEDVEGMQDVFYHSWLDTYPNQEYGITRDDIEYRFRDRHGAERLEKRRAEIRAQDQNRKFIVAKDGTKVVGLCRASKTDEKNQLDAIYLLPEYQGKGIGTMLWKETLSFFDKTKDIFISVATYNKQAINFYAKLGFIDTGRRFSDERFALKSRAEIPEMEMVIRTG
jgi:ribosomal protein S18 acetylase RimI-like enzyme